MSLYSTRTILTLCSVFIALMLSPTSQAYLSYEVNQAMDKANTCKQAQQSHIYSECMRLNNEWLKKTVFSKSEYRMQSFASSKKQKVLKNINIKIQSNTQHCKDEKTRYGDSMTGERRFPYCQYENMLELLINVERNIDIYSH